MCMYVQVHGYAGQRSTLSMVPQVSTTLICVCLCVCVYVYRYMHSYIYIHVCIPMCSYVETRGQYQMSFSISLYLTFLRQGLIDLGLTLLVGQWSPGILSLSAQSVLPCLAFTWVWGIEPRSSHLHSRHYPY